MLPNNSKLLQVTNKEALVNLCKLHSQKKVGKILGISQSSVGRLLEHYEVPSPRSGNTKSSYLTSTQQDYFNPDNVSSIDERVCISCGSRYRNTRKSRNYCSGSCSSAHKAKIHREQKVKQWLGGDHAAALNAGGHLKYAIRLYLLQQANFQCSECGIELWHPKDGRCCLQIHHVDGNWKNNHPDNLQVICPNCHSLTDDYCSRNRGNGRKGKQRNTRCREREHLVLTV